MEEKRYSYIWLYVALAAVLIGGTIIMYRFGLGAVNMPDATKELNKLMNEKLVACSGGAGSERCKEAGAALKKFERKWFNQAPSRQRRKSK